MPGGGGAGMPGGGGAGLPGGGGAGIPGGGGAGLSGGSKYVQKPAKTMNPQEAQMAINKGNEDTIRDTASIVSHKYASDEVLLGKAKTDEMANMQHKSVNSER